MASKLPKKLRKVHYWLSVFVMTPALVIFVTGILLQVKKHSDWIQPPLQKGSGDVPTLSFEQILESAQSVPELGVKGWSDIKRLDVRPGKGVTKIRGASDLEVQIDNSTGEVLQVAERRSDWIESLHDGSYFSNPVKYGIFLTTAVLLVVMLLTGVYLFFLPLVRKRGKKKSGDQEGAE